MSITLWLLAAIISVSAVTYAVLYAGGAVNRWFCVVLPVGVLLYLWFAGDLFRADAILIVKFFSVCFGAWLVANIRFDGWLGRSWGGGLGFEHYRASSRWAPIYAATSDTISGSAGC